jgi:3'-phosphoadenosine 5'-phosphosulfate sulfotransferase (PAPS reductase)/FAD synthetase
MTKLLLDNWSDRYDFIVTFANTGLEHPKTLDFIHNCDTHFGFNTVWLESVVHHDKRSAPTHKVVDYASAARNGGPFEEVIKKYGVPNQKFPGCTRDLKLNPIKSYLKSLGINEHEVPTAIGIRTDELRRVNPKVAQARTLIYPLINTWPSDKQDVLDWWEDQAFDLGIDEFEGNCLGCWKKSFKKHFMQIERDPSVYDFHRRMESEHEFTGPQEGHRHFFRGDVSTVRLFQMYEENKGASARPAASIYEDAGCAESCELFETIVNDTLA